MRKTSVILPLKALVILCGAAFVPVAALLAPEAGRLIAGTFADAVDARLCAAYLYLTMAPALLALWDAWHIFRDIGLDKSFSRINAARLKRVSWCAAADTAMYGALCASAYIWGNGGGSITVNYTAFIALMISFFGVLLTVVVRALSALVLDASRIKDENDLTV